MKKEILVKLSVFSILALHGCGYDSNIPVQSQQTSNISYSNNTCTCPDTSKTSEKVAPKTTTVSKPTNTDTLKPTVSDTKVITEKATETKKETKVVLADYILSKMIETDKKNVVFESTFTNYSIGKDKKTGKDKETTITARMTFKKPDKALLNVIDSPEAMARGSRILYTGGDKVKVKAAGVLGLIPVFFDINDTMFENARGHKLLSAMEGIRRLSDPATKVEVLGTSTVNGNKVYVLKIVTPEKLDPEITHEMYYVDASTFIVLSTEMYVNNRIVGQYKIKDIKIYNELSDDFFQI